MTPQEAVLRFLEGAGRRDEAEFYLGLFRDEAKERFATFLIDAQVVRHALEAVVLDLRFLSVLGLTPVVVLGVVDPGRADAHAGRLLRRLEVAGVAARVLPPDDPKLHELAIAQARAGTLPIIPFGSNDGATAEARFDRLAGLLRALVARKLIVLTRRGPLREQGAPISIVNLTSDFGRLTASGELTGKQQLLLAQARRLIFEGVPHRLVVSITSPLDLLRELFTMKGAGTLLRRGFTIHCRTGWDEVDRARVAALLASSFGRTPRAELFQRPVARIYLEETYRGAAIVIDTVLGAYLSKFAVEREAQGEGMGRDLWDLVVADHPTLFWRGRRDNPISSWYDRHCDGLMRFPGWNIYWRGLDVARIPAAIANALGQPGDFAATDPADV